MSTGTGSWVWQNPLPQGNALWGVSCADVSHCVLVGDAGTTLTTSNSGLRWLSGASRTDRNLIGVSCPTALICFSVGDAGVILRSADGGLTWSAQTSGTAQDLSGISCPNPAACFAVGASGTIRATTDGGANWVGQLSPSPSMPLNAISCGTSTACVAVGGTQPGGIALFTTDRGVHWSTGNPALVNRLLSVSCPSATVCLAVGEWGTGVKTTDGGANWATLNASGFGSGVTGISCPTTTTCLALDPAGTHVTTDGGITWSTRSTSTSWTIACPSVAVCYTAGLYGAIATTSDGGISWYSLSYTVTTEPLVRVRCPTTSTCFALGNEALYHIRGGPYPASILGTTDGGRTWLKLYETPFGGIQDISCPTASTCFASVVNAILSTTDGGRSWTQHIVAPIGTDGTSPFAVYGIDCPTTTVCFAVGSMPHSTAVIVYTTNGWATWAVIPSAGPQYLGSVSCPNIHTCVATGYAGMTMRTTDGVNWSVSTAPTVATQQLGPIDCPSATACFAVAGYPNQVFATTDGGVTWLPQSLPPVQTLGSVDCPTPATCLVATRGGILRTTNAGANWSLLSAGTTNGLFGLDCPAITVCFAAGDAGTILALPLPPRAEVAQPALPQSSPASRLVPPPVPPSWPGVPLAVTSITVRPNGPTSPAPAAKLQERVAAPAIGWLLAAVQAVEEQASAIYRGHHWSNSTRRLL
jgi:photosystem II stability/assembly factor-like uncharacterized protein